MFERWRFYICKIFELTKAKSLWDEWGQWMKHFCEYSVGHISGWLWHRWYTCQRFDHQHQDSTSDCCQHCMNVWMLTFTIKHFESMSALEILRVHWSVDSQEDIHGPFFKFLCGTSILLVPVKQVTFWNQNHWYKKVSPTQYISIQFYSLGLGFSG